MSGDPLSFDPSTPDSDLDHHLVAALEDASGTDRLLVVAEFDTALSPPVDDPADARTDPASSEALNVLQAIAGTTVAVVSGRSLDDLWERLGLSGMKGGVLMAGRRGEEFGGFGDATPQTVDPDDAGTVLNALRARAGATAVLYVGGDEADERAFAALRADDVGVKVGGGETAAAHRVEDTDGVVEVLEEIMRLRRR